MLFPHNGSEPGANHAWFSSLGISALVHALLIAVLGVLWIELPHSQNRTVLDTQWTAVDAVPELTEISDPVAREPIEFQEEISADLGGSLARGTEHKPLEVRPLSERATNPHQFAGATDGLDLTEHVAFLGEGVGGGESGGSGAGFFGIKVNGKRFVYVVDCSTSMNHPHSGEGVTRFGRVKLELLRSISKMDSSKQFFLIFFNDMAIPMPADSAQSADRSTQERYLQWMANIRASGRTDPRPALALAFKLRPDVIYFLTDGEFPPVVEADLRNLHQQEVVIHTYAFGDRYAEDVMKAVAEANGGTYRFVP